jgi:hemerythrin-like domain-containing protein
MSDSIALWHAEHVNFARLLDLLDRQLRLFHKGESPDYELMLDIMFYMTHYPDLQHHPKEDLAFARIGAREPSVRATIDDLSAQHGRLKAIGEELVHALDDVVNGSIESRMQVEGPGRAYVDLFRHHMRTEETMIMPLAARLLDDADWAAISAAVAHLDDPLFVHAEQRYAALREQIGV